MKPPEHLTTYASAMFPDTQHLNMEPPVKLRQIEQETKVLGFDMPSIRETGSLLRTLAASKPGAHILELGTGTGLATCWLLDGMDESAELITIDIDPKVIRVAERNLGEDCRLTIICEDGAKFLVDSNRSFDLIFAGAWPGKFTHLKEAFLRLADDGIYVVDDLLPQESWPENHAPRVPALIDEIQSQPELDVEYRDWATGILIARKHNKRMQSDAAKPPR